MSESPSIHPLRVTTLVRPPTLAADPASTAGARAHAPGLLAPLVLLHGFTGDASTWAPLVRALGRERKVLAVDLVGHGGSPAPDDPRAYRMEAVLASLRQAIASSLGPAARPHLLGYSMGGRVALSLAASEPGSIASLTLVGATPGIADPAERAERRRQDAALAAFIEEAGLEAFIDRWMAHPLFATQSVLGPAYLAGARAQRLRCNPRALAHTLRELGTGSMPALWDRLPEIDTPCLLVAGGRDSKFVTLAEAMAAPGAGLPDARMHIVEGAGHAVQVEAPRALAELVHDFLAELETRRD